MNQPGASPPDVPPPAPGLAALGPYFAVETHDPVSPLARPWVPLAGLITSPGLLRARVQEVREALAAAAGRQPETVEFRVAASVAQLGLAARMLSPVIGAAALGYALSFDAGQARWIPSLGGPFRLSLPAQSPQAAGRRDARAAGNCSTGRSAPWYGPPRPWRSPSMCCGATSARPSTAPRP